MNSGSEFTQHAPGSDSTSFPLSAAQRSIWFAQELDPDTPLAIAQYVDVVGPLDVDLLGRVGRVVAREFDTVMVRLVPGDPEPRQVVDPDLRDAMVHLDFRDRDDPVADALAWMRSEFAAPLDMFESRLMEVATLRVGEQRWFWYTRIHHVLLDGYGAAVFAERAADLYDAAVSGRTPSPNKAGTAADIVGDDAAYRASPRFARDAQYWAERVRDLAEPVRLAEPTGVTDIRSAMVGETVGDDVRARIDAACIRWSTSVPALVGAAVAIYLARMTNVSDVTLSLPVSARTSALLRRSGGMVSNVVPVRVQVGPRTTAAGIVGSIGRDIVGALRHQRYRFEDMRAAESAAAGSPGTGRGFFGTPINIMTFRKDSVMGPCTGRAHILTTGPVEDLAVNVDTGGGGLRIDLEANPTVYDEAALAAHHRGITGILRALIVATGDGFVADLAGDLEVASVRGGPPAAAPALLPGIVDRTVRLHGERPAVVSGDRRFTYRELDSRANRLARVLVDHGVGPGDFVAVLLSRGMHSLIAELAVGKAGGAFVPIDPALPEDRIEYLISDSGVTLGIVDEPHPGHGAVEWIDLRSSALAEDFAARSGAAVTDADRRSPLRLDHPAYMIYTSGSTGLPKGVVIGHRGIASLAAEQVERYGIDCYSRTLHFASPSFDASVLELLLAVASGATMVIAGTEVYGGEDLRRLLVTERVTHAFVTPAALASVDPDGIDDLGVVVVGGEACSPGLVGRWARARRMFNAYGPTECTVMSTVAGPLDADRPVTIGGPVTGSHAVVLDDRLRPVPTGAVGELYVGGACVGIGYHDRTGATSARFVADLLGPPGSRLYRTGDVVRVATDDTLIYLGRSDDQIKVRGFRIELGEVDSALHDVPGVVRAVADVRVVAGQPTLVAYVERSAALADADADRAVTAHLRKVLPPYAVPQSVVMIDEVPLTTAGKVDRRALPAPTLLLGEYVALRTATEHVVAEAFGTVLGPRADGGDGYGASDDFFAGGGNSLLATRLASLIGARTGVRVPVRTVFEFPTVAALAAAADELGPGGVRRPLTRIDSLPGPVPLAPAQHRMWVVNQYDTRLATYNVPIVLHLRGPVDVTALHAAVLDVVGRHEALRTSYPDSPDGPVQHVHDLDEVASQITVTPGWTTDEDAGARALQIATTGFDVSRAVPLRIEILTVSADHLVLVCVVHHIGADGSSTMPLARDLATAYRARTSAGTPQWDELPVRYTDYTVWHHDYMGSDNDPGSVISRQLEYWSLHLSGLPDRLDLPFDRPRPAVASLVGGRIVRHADDGLAGSVVSLAATYGVTPFMVTHAALVVLLARLSGTTDIAVGTPVAGRGDPATENLVGMFVGTVVLRTTVPAELPFADLLRRVESVDLEALENADVPFDRLVELLNPVRAASHHPLVQVGFSYQNMAPSSFDLDGVEVEIVEPDVAVAKFDLHLTVVERTGGLDVHWEFARDVFDAETVDGIADRFESILTAALESPSTPVGDLAVACPVTLEPVGRVPRALGGTVADLLDAGSALGAAASATALVEDATGRTVAYTAVRAEVFALARLLIENGVGPESRVAVALPRSVEMVESIWAVIMAGGAYVPIDPDAPTDRIRSVVSSSRAVLALRSAEHAEPWGVPTLDPSAVDLSGYDTTPVTDADRLGRLHPSATVYVMFTSGSTGTPKGVALSHRAVATQLQWKRDYHSERSDGSTRVHAGVLRTPVTFDLSVWELMGPVLGGAELVIARPDGHRDPRYVADLLARSGVRTAHFVPSLLDAHLETEHADLDHILCIGEALSVVTAERAARSTGAMVDNLYGPTEAAVGVTVHRWRSGAGGSGTVPIGRPMAGTDVRVLDGRLHPVPVGVPGELYLSGAQLASWYEGRPDLTAERFVAGHAGVRLYRTGDLVRVRRDGELEFLGRNDSQLKLRGQRIELGEIEAVIAADSRISGAAVSVHRGERLVAYVVPAPGIDAVEVGAPSVIERLGRSLPGYMIPSSVTVLDALPRTVNGKLDRRALPEPPAAERLSTPLSTPTERRVADVFTAVLGSGGSAAASTSLGADDDFFGLGGTSLTATRVAARLGAEFGADVPVSAVFESPTVAGLARWVESAGHHPRPPLARRPRPFVLPLSRSQSRMWVLNRLDPSSALYNLAVSVRLAGTVDIDALTTAVRDVIDRHEILRTVYPSVGGRPSQYVLPTDRVVALTRTDDTTATVRRGFDLTVDPPLRWSVSGEAPTILVVVVHHIAADAGSFGPLITDILTAYTARRQDVRSRTVLTALPVQFADYALWERDLLGADGAAAHASIEQRRRFWMHTLADLPDPLELPTDRPRPAVRSHAGAAVRDELTPQMLAALRARVARDRSTIFMAVHTALSITLARVSGSEDIVVGTPVDGRGRAELDGLVGMFVSTVVLRSVVDPDLSIRRHLLRSRDTVVAALAASEVPFEDLVAALGVDRSGAHHPIFQVMLGFQDAVARAVEHDGLEVRVEPVELPVARFDLQVTVDEPAEGSDLPLGITWTYATDIFDKSTVVGFAATFRRVLDSLVADAPTAVGDLDILGPERAAEIERWSEGPPSNRFTRRASTLADLLDRGAADHGDTAAATFGSTTVDRAEFARMVARCARRLVAADVGPGTVVAVALPRSLDMVVVMHAVVTAGAAVMPLDLDQPVQRIAAMLGLAAPKLVVTDDAGSVPPLGGVRVLGPGEVTATGVDESPLTDRDRRAPLLPRHPAYVIFTSGSTGEPKGVVVPHEGIVNRLNWMQESYPVGPGDTLLQKTPVTFDVSVWELFWGFVTGARTVIADPGAHREPARMHAVLDAENITVAHFVPSVLEVFLAATRGDLPSLRLLFTSGEALSIGTATAARQRLSADIHNLYGPTEASVDVTGYPVPARGIASLDPAVTTVPIGRPFPGVRTRVLDSRLRPVDAGIAGELYLGGVQLASGYLSRGSLTAARFVADPYSAGERLYRTGDLVRFSRTEPGVLEFLGRTDFQVKIRGLRIEAGEIEAAIRSIPAVSRCVVAVRREMASDGEVVAYVVPERGRHVDHDVVVLHTREILPQYMIPARTIILENIPATSAGKVDRKALPAPVRTERTRTTPRTETERVVLEVLCTAVGSDDVGVDSDFFGVGGTSLSAAVLVAGIADRLGVTLGLRAVFEARTASELAALVDGAPAAGSEPRVSSGTATDMTAAQLRMWVHTRLDPDSAAYHVVLPLVVDGITAALPAARAAVRDVILRHEALHTVYPDDGDGPRPRVLDAAAVEQLLDGAVQVSADDEVTERALRGFDLVRELPLRLVLGARGSRAILVVHHIATDGWSTKLVAADLAVAFDARRRGEAPAWAAPAGKFSDILARRRPEDRAGRLDFWKRTLAGAPALALPRPDRPRPPVRNYRGAVVHTSVGGDVRTAVASVATRGKASVFAVLHAALVVTLARSGAGEDVVIGVPTAGRDDPASHTAVGMFVTTLAMRTRYRPLLTFTEAVDDSAHHLLDVLDHGGIDIEEIVDGLAMVRERTHHPVFQMTLDVDDTDVQGVASAHDDVAVVTDLDVAVARFDLEFTVRRRGTDLDLSLVYRPDLYDEATARTLLRRWALVLRSAVSAPDRPLRAFDVRLPGELRDSAPHAGPVRLLPDVLDDTGDLVDGASGHVLHRDAARSRVNRLARRLIARGVGTGDVVAVGIARSIESVLAVRAVAATGAAFVPIDPAGPPGRIAHMIADSGAVTTLTRADIDDVDTETTTTTSDGTDPGRPIGDADRLRPLHPDASAYLIYTSGSTGAPKAVSVTHRGLAAFTEEMKERFAVQASSRVLHAASSIFDASILEMLMAAGGGADLVVAPTDVYGGDALAALLRREEVTHVFLTPGALDTLPSTEDRSWPDLEVMVVGGDVCPPELAREWVRSGVRFFDAYGPTESTVAATIAGPLADADGAVPIGVPVRGSSVRLLDPAWSDVPVGVVGEMYLGGAGVAAGYHGRPALTAATFVADPDGPPGSRRFRSGDLGRWSGGQLHHHGRNDSQVKIRGQRVEIGEIETALRRVPGVESAVVVVRSVSGPDELLAYVTVSADEMFDARSLLDELARMLPRYMIPRAVTRLEAMPLTPAGKIDRAVLPDPVVTRREYVPPRGEWEPLVARIFADVLGGGSAAAAAVFGTGSADSGIGALDDFFTLGGDSLTATRVVSRIRTASGREPTVRALFDAPTVRGFAAAVEASSAGIGPEPGTIELPERLPLSFAQQRMWFLNRFDPSSTTENVPIVIRLRGDLDENAFEGALADLIRRHDVLRTVYPDSADGPYQAVRDADATAMKLTRQLATPHSLDATIRGVVDTEFDVTREPPIRAELIRLDDPDHVGVVEHVCVAVIHHIAVDGVSVVRLAGELAEAYTARRAGSMPSQPAPTRETPGRGAPSLQYADFAVWQRAILADDHGRTAREAEYWRSRLAGLPVSVDLPFDRPRPAVMSGRGSSVAFTLPPELHGEMAALAAPSGSTVFMVAHAALAVLLSRIGDNTDVVVGTPVSGRGHERFDRVVGMFVNMLALRTTVRPESSGLEILAGVREGDLEAFAHAETPFDRIVGIVDPPRTRAHHPLFQVAISFQNIGQVGLGLPDLTLDVVDTEVGVAEFDLHLTLAPMPNGELDARITYATELFDRTSVEALAQRYETVVRELIRTPERAVGDLDIFDDADTVHTDPDPEATSSSLLGRAFLARAEEAPDSVAVVDGDTVLTYRDLSARVRALSRTLRTAGVTSDAPTAVALPRGVDRIVAMYAVVLAGGAYVPIVSADTERASRILDTSDPRVVLTSAELADAELLRGRRVVVVPDVAGIDVAGIDAVGTGTGPHDVPSPAGAAYVLFTSGSTGIPKGVSISHRAVSTQLDWMQRRFALSADDAVLLHTAAGFDLSVWEYWWPLQVGARVVVAPPAAERDAAQLVAVLERTEVTVLCVVPTTLAMLLERPAFPASVRLVLCIGDVLPADLAARLASRSTATLVNLYGPTEAAVSVTAFEFDAATTAPGSSAVPIGRPHPTVGVRILDRRLRPVPTSVVGELYLTGPQLARGYHGESARTAEAFVADVENGGERMYRTGDLVRRRPDGEVEYVARVDRQVKIRGFRIELGEIESALRACDDVIEAVVDVVEAASPRARIAAFVVGAPGLDPDSLPDRLQGTLPAHMIPRQVVLLDAIPMTSNGKVDRTQLPVLPVPVRSYRAPRTATEKLVAHTIAASIAVDRVGLDDNFFELGGNSLDATRVVSALESATGRAVPVRIIFDRSTVAAVAAAVDEELAGGRDIGLPALRRVDSTEVVPLAPSQHRIHDAVSARVTGDWNVPFAVRLDARPSLAVVVPAIEKAVDDLVIRHESLRTLHPTGEHGAVLSVVATPADAPLVRVDVVSTSYDEIDAELAEFGWMPFDVAEELPLRVRVFRIESPKSDDSKSDDPKSDDPKSDDPGSDNPESDDRGPGEQVAVLALVVHHISADGASTGPLLGDMVAALAARLEGRAPDFAPLGASFRDFAAWRTAVLESGEERARQLGLWVRRFTRETPRPRLQTDRPRPEVWDSTGATVSVDIGADEHRRLVAYARSLGAGVFAVLQAAFAVVLADLADDGDVAVATANANRSHAAVAGVVGNFSEDVPMRLDARDGVSFTDLVLQVKEQLAQALSAPDVSAPMLLTALGEPGGAMMPSENPLFPATLILQDAVDAGSGIEIGGVRMTPYPVPGTVAKHEVEVTLREHRSGREPAGITGTVLYPVALFDDRTIRRRVADAVAVVLRAVGERPRTVGELRGVLP